MNLQVGQGAKKGWLFRNIKSQKPETLSQYHPSHFRQITPNTLHQPLPPFASTQLGQFPNMCRSTRFSFKPDVLCPAVPERYLVTKRCVSERWVSYIFWYTNKISLKNHLTIFLDWAFHEFFCYLKKGPIISNTLYFLISRGVFIQFFLGID